MLRVGVVGAGAAGLVAARLLAASPESFAAPVVFEQLDRLGGTWVYTERVGTDKHGLPIHSSMYRNLRTNLPKEVMGFPDFPFEPSSCNGKSFISHEDVLDYLCRYTDNFHLHECIQLETCVESVTPLDSDDPLTGFRVTTRDLNTNRRVQHHFDAMIICNGHYAAPAVPDIPGKQEFGGQIIHSHDYRVPQPYAGKHVIVLGGRASGIDISIQVAKVAKKVYLAHNGMPFPSMLPANMTQTVGIERLESSGVVLLDGRRLAVDVLILCTGYNYEFPFLSRDCGVTVEDRQVKPLYKHIIHIDLQRLAFIGLPSIVLPFPLFHKQVEFVLAALSGRHQLPSRADMTADTAQDLAARAEMKLPARHAHLLGQLQWEYNDWLADAAGTSRIPAVNHRLYDEVHVRRVLDLAGYKEHVFRVTGDDEFVEVTPDVASRL